METIGLALSMALTLMVFSFIIGDNPLFKLAEHIFVGVSVAYVILVGWHLVIAPFFFLGISSDGYTLLLKLPPAFLCLFLIFKVRPNPSGVENLLGSISLAFLIGIGAALAIEGALFGTLLPQAAETAAINLNPSSAAYANAPGGNVMLHNDFWSNIVVVIGVVGTLFYFTFAYRPQKYLGGLREGFVNFWAGIGRLIILITLGALFSNTVSARIALLLSRVQFLVDGFLSLVGR
jgi:hypothetical protein